MPTNISHQTLALAAARLARLEMAQLDNSRDGYPVPSAKDVHALTDRLCMKARVNPLQARAHWLRAQAGTECSPTLAYRYCASLITARLTLG